MPYQPNLSSVHVDAALTNFSIAYMQDATNFVADVVFPNVPVQKKSDVYFTFSKDAFLRAGGKQVPYGQEAPSGGFDLATGSYDVGSPWRWGFKLTPDVLANADSALSIDQAASNFVMQGLLVQREIQWASKYFQTGVWGTDMAGVAFGSVTSPTTQFVQWSDDANSDPISDVSTGRATILSNTGYLPNTLTVSFWVHEALKKHPLIVDRFKYTSADSINEAMLANLFEVDRYLVAKAVQATSAEGQTVTTALVLGKSALLCYSAPAPGLLAHSAGYNFVWSGLTGMNNLGVAVTRTPMPWLGIAPAGGVTELIEGQAAYALKVTGSDLGYFFSNATA
jgi:hypothetical protein